MHVKENREELPGRLFRVVKPQALRLQDQCQFIKWTSLGGGVSCHRAGRCVPVTGLGYASLSQGGMMIRRKCLEQSA